MRSPQELLFRMRQELANLRMALRTPQLTAPASGMPIFPDPAPVAARLRTSALAAEVVNLADQILRGLLPILGFTIETGPEIDWRRDYVHGISSGLDYFRRVPYLDFEKVGDHKIVWELNRHQHLVVLAQAFLFTGKQDYLSRIAADLASWNEQNSFGSGMNWTSALEVAFRALSWIWVEHLVGPHWDERCRRNLLASLWQHGRYLESNLSIYFSPNTHLLGEAVALHAIGRRLQGCARTARWRAEGVRLVREQMERQVEEDGSHFERSLYYHIYAVDFFLLHAALAEPGPAFLEKLGRMADFLASLSDPAGAIPLIGDDDGGRLFHPYGPRKLFGGASLAALSVLLGRNDLPYRDGDPATCAAWLFGARAPEVPPPAPRPRTSTLFRNCGLAVMRAENIRIVIDAGSFGPGNAGHSHSDALAICISRGEHEILLDPGTYTYIADPVWRRRFRGSSAHNTIRIDGRDQASPAGPFAWKNKPRVQLHHWAVGPESDYLDATCEFGVGQGIATHRRRVLFVKPCLLVVLDDLAGPPGEHLIEQFWHTGPDAIPGAGRAQVGGAAIVFPEDLPLEVVRGGEFGWRSEVFGAKSEASVIRRHWTSTFPAHASAILDFSGGALDAVQESPGVFRLDSHRMTVRMPPAGPPEILRWC